MLRKARSFAQKMYAGVKRRDGRTPAVDHPAQVVSILESIGVTDEETLSAAWLHDVMEECDVSYSQLCEKFNSRVADMVADLTRDVDRESYRERIRNASRAVKLIKVADALHNCRTLHCELHPHTINHKVEDCQELLLAISQQVSPYLHRQLQKSIEPWIS